MASTFDFSKLRNHPETKGIIVDLFMLALVFVNLGWIFFDWLFTSELIQSGIAATHYGFYIHYRDNIHPNFVAYDLIFVSIYLGELAIRWIIAIHQKTYHRWFFFPFVRWYDVLGSIPIGSFRFLRILRAVAIIYRLKNMGVINLENNAFYTVFNKYLTILVEEVSDRVVLSVLNGVQTEIKGGHPITENIKEQVIQPKIEEINHWIKYELGIALRESFEENEPHIKTYLTDVLAQTISSQNTTLSQYNFVDKRIRQVSRQLSDGLLFELVWSIINDLTDPETHRVSLITASLGNKISDQARTEIVSMGEETLIGTIELIKEYVQIQQWKSSED